MTTGPEAKAAEAGFARECNACPHQDKAFKAECHLTCMVEEIRKANAAHYLPLLRRCLPENQGEGTTQMIRDEIARLEKGIA